MLELHSFGLRGMQGPYVLLLVSLGGGTKSNTIQTGLLVSAYRGLSRPFRKNVKFIILVRPSKPLKALLAFLKPFVSRKAHRKVLKVRHTCAMSHFLCSLRLACVKCCRSGATLASRPQSMPLHLAS